MNGAEPAKMAEPIGIVRSSVEWLVLRPVSSVPGQQISGGRLAVMGPKGVRDVDFVTVRRDGAIVVPTEPAIEDQRICVLDDGFVPYDITALVRQGGQHTCVLEPAARFDIELKDMNEAEARVDLRLRREPDQPGDEEKVVWPTASSESAYSYDLARGTYRLEIEDDSILIWSGGEAVVVTDSTAQQRSLVLVGVVAAAIRPTMVEIRTFEIERYPPELITVHKGRIPGAAQRLQALMDAGILVQFAATRSLAHRHTIHSVPVLLGAGDGTSTRHAVAFQPLGQVVPQDFRLETVAGAGRLKVSVVGPGGARLDGVDVGVYEQRMGASGKLVAMLKSGDDWRELAPGKYTLIPRLPPDVLPENRSVEASIASAEATEAVIRIPKDMVAADLRIELASGVVPRGASVRIHGDGMDSVYSSLKPERIRVWVLPAKLSVQVYVSEEAQAEVQVDFATAGPHRIIVSGK